MGINRHSDTTKPEWVERHKEAFDKHLWRNKIPRRHWYPKPERFRPQSVSLNVPWLPEDRQFQVGAKDQQETITDIIEGSATRDKRWLVAVGCEPVAATGIEFFVAAARRSRELGMPMPQIVNLARTPDDIQLSMPAEKGVLLLHNIAADSHKYRIQNCRDWIEEASNIFTIVVVSNSDPVSFFHRLGKPYDRALYFKGDHGEARKRRV